MHVVTVEFDIHPEALEKFRAATLQQARSSLGLERDCCRFDVCENAGSNQIFLYEIYSNRDAFLVHLSTRHYKKYQKLVADWVIEKRVKEFSLVEKTYEQ